MKCNKCRFHNNYVVSLGFLQGTTFGIYAVKETIRAILLHDSQKINEGGTLMAENQRIALSRRLFAEG
ncbi:MAG: hypothetical protein ACI4SP_04680, partial [Eubacteriales bacterium]